MSIDASSARFARQRILSGFGLVQQQKLAAARVVVIGAGGLGCSVLPMLAAAGVGAITVVDDDLVEESNLHRQTLFSLADVGRLKADVAAEALRRLSPGAVVTARAVRFEPQTAVELARDADVLVDASDTQPTRYLANDTAAAMGIPLVWGNALGWAGQVGIAWDAKGADYRDLFPTPAVTDDATCALMGVLPTVCAVIGGLMANETLKLLSGSGETLLGRVVHFDARNGGFRELDYRRDPDARRSDAEIEADSSHGLSPLELRQALSDAEIAPVLLDVREPWEAELARLPGSVLIPLGELTGRFGELDSAAPTVVYCHHGARSAQAMDYLSQIGFENVTELDGGIDAWSRQLDPTVGRY